MGLSFNQCVCNGCHDVLMMSIGFNSITILVIHDVSCHCIIFGISENECIKKCFTVYSKKKNKEVITLSEIEIRIQGSFGKKSFNYSIGYKDDKIVKSLCIMLPQMSVYAKSFDGAKYMSLLIKHDK